MTANEIKNAILNVPYISESNTEAKIFEGFTALKKAIISAKSIYINKSVITGIWYLKGLAYEEGNPQIIVRTNVMRGNEERLHIEAEIWEFIKNDVSYDYNDNLLCDDGIIKGNQEELISEINSGNVFAVYDKERE